MAMSNGKQALIALGLALLATVWVEHSLLDVHVSQTLYQSGKGWLIDKHNRYLALLFYKLPKYALIGLVVWLIGRWWVGYWHTRRHSPSYTTPNAGRQSVIRSEPLRRPYYKWSLIGLAQFELAYLIVALLATPTLVAIIKTITQVPCPSDVTLFGGTLAYADIITDMLTRSGNRCFPASHASVGFACYALAFVPSLKRHKGTIVGAVTALGWVMGGYKMAIGDHFFSHTLVSMLLGWAVSAGLAQVWFVHSSKKTFKKNEPS